MKPIIRAAVVSCIFLSSVAYSGDPQLTTAVTFGSVSQNISDADGKPIATYTKNIKGVRHRFLKQSVHLLRSPILESGTDVADLVRSARQKQQSLTFLDANNNVVTLNGNTLPANVTKISVEYAAGADVTDEVTSPCVPDVSHLVGGCAISYSSLDTGLMNDLSANPFSNNAQSVKISVAQYNMYMSDSIIMPLRLATGLVANSNDVAASNRLKLLDPDQGTVNFSFGWAAKWHIYDFCAFQVVKGQCTIAANGGVRYLGLKKTTAGNGTTTDNEVGGFASSNLSLVFPIFPADAMGNTIKNPGADDTGELGIKVGATYFKQNINNDSGGLFPDAVDESGKPIKVRGSFGEYGGVATLRLPYALSLTATYYKAMGNSAVGHKSTVSLSYAFGKAGAPSSQ